MQEALEVRVASGLDREFDPEYREDGWMNEPRITKSTLSRHGTNYSYWKHKDSSKTQA